MITESVKVPGRTLLTVMTLKDHGSQTIQNFWDGTLPQRLARQADTLRYEQSFISPEKLVSWPKVKGVRTTGAKIAEYTTYTELVLKPSRLRWLLSSLPALALAPEDHAYVSSIQAVQTLPLLGGGLEYMTHKRESYRNLILLKRATEVSAKAFLQFCNTVLLPTMLHPECVEFKVYQLMQVQDQEGMPSCSLTLTDYDVAIVIGTQSLEGAKQLFAQTRLCSKEQSHYMSLVHVFRLHDLRIYNEYGRALLPASHAQKIPKPALEPVMREGILPIPARSALYKSTPTLALQKIIPTASKAPEDVVCDTQGRLYYGLETGDVFMYDPAFDQHEKLINTGGRPLGLAWAANGLYICDAHKGLLRLDLKDKNLETLVTHVYGRPLRFCSNVACAKDGTLWFTQSTERFDFEHYLGAFIEHRASGQLCRRDPDGVVHVVLDDLFFPNGITLDEQEQSVIFAQTGAYSIARYWIKGRKKGQLETLVDNLPGLPDNVSKMRNGRFWVALVAPRSKQLDNMSQMSTRLRRAIWRLPDSFGPKVTKTVWVMAFDAQGVMQADLQDEHDAFYAATGVVEVGETLYLGSMSVGALAQVSIHEFLQNLSESND